ncbi:MULTISPECIES: hypothetical protein [Streptomyces]|uniref:hypothetical protein n=1 Tax=Streptomyces TaxID=1883 RepID=UPI001558EB84|nr:hypothetical protein [Streptomyces kasugaensis]
MTTAVPAAGRGIGEPGSVPDVAAASRARKGGERVGGIAPFRSHGSFRRRSSGASAGAPEPTTVRRPLEECGHLAVQLLLTGLAHAPTARETVLRAEPVGRRTT